MDSARKLIIVAAILLLPACEAPGACLGTQGIFDNDYCYSDFSAGECDEYAAEEVNGASWDFYSGETCADLGYLEGSN